MPVVYSRHFFMPYIFQEGCKIKNPPACDRRIFKTKYKLNEQYKHRVIFGKNNIYLMFLFIFLSKIRYYYHITLNKP